MAVYTNVTLQSAITGAQGATATFTVDNDISDVQLTIPTGTTITLIASDLNHNTLTALSTARHFTISGTGNLTLRNFKLIGNGDNSGGVTVPGAGFATFENCTFDSCKTTTDNGGAVNMSSTSTVTFSGTSVIKNCEAINGGGIYLGSNATLNLTGTHIFQNAAKTNGSGSNRGLGGGIYVATSTSILNVSGALIEDNTAEIDGGGIYFYQAKTANNNITSITVSNNQAIHGGGIYARQALTFANATITGNEALLGDLPGGGGLYVNGGLILSDSEISNNHSVYNGAGMVLGDATHSLTQVNIFGNVASPPVGLVAQGGGGIFLNSSIPNTTTLQDVHIYNNSAVSGGGLYSINSGTVTLQGSTIIGSETPGNGNTANDHGGGVYLANGSIMFLQDGTRIVGNTANKNGGGAYLFSNNTSLTLQSGSQIANNTATLNGGGVWINNVGILNIEAGSQVVGNTAQGNTPEYDGLFGGGGIFNSYGTVNLSGGLIQNNTATHGHGGGVLVRYNDYAHLAVTSGSIINNTAPQGDGGGIFLDWGIFLNWANPPATTTSISIAAPAIFNGNLSRLAYHPPTNISRFTNINFASTSIYTHILNNHDINFKTHTLTLHPQNGTSNTFQYIVGLDGADTGVNGPSSRIPEKPTDPTPATTNQVFLGWTTSNGTSFDWTAPINADLDLYATYADLITVIFNRNNSGIPQQVIQAGELVVEPDGSVLHPREEWHDYYLGWAYEGENSTFNFAEPLTADSYGLIEEEGALVLYLEVKFAPIIFYHLIDGDNTDNMGTMLEGRTQSQLDTFVRQGRPDGFQISGWYTDDQFLDLAPTDFTQLGDDIWAYTNVADSRSNFVPLLNSNNSGQSLYGESFDTLLIRGQNDANPSELTLGNTVALTRNNRTVTLRNYEPAGAIIKVAGNYRHLNLNADNCHLTFLKVQLQGNNGTDASDPEASGGGIDTVMGYNVTLTDQTNDPNWATLTQCYHTGNGGAIYNLAFLTLQNVVVTNSRGTYGGGLWTNRAATLTNCRFAGNYAYGSSPVYNGGAIFVDGAVQLDINGTTVTGNTSEQAGAGVCARNGATIIANHCHFTHNIAEDSSGGGLYLYGSSAQFTDGEISNNTANTNGGAICISGGGHFEGENVEMSYNIATGDSGQGWGGAVEIWNGSMTLTSAQLGNNDGVYGGAIGLHGTVTGLELTDVHLEENIASDSGGAIFATSMNNFFTVEASQLNVINNQAPMGGAIYHDYSAELNLKASTLQGNTAQSGDGGAIYSDGATLIIEDLEDDDTPTLFDQNTAPDGNGGAIYLASATLEITGTTTFTANTAQNGGGIYTTDLTYQNLATAEATTFANNEATAGDYEPPTNALSDFENIQFQTSSNDFEHPLNNDDINAQTVIVQFFAEDGSDSYFAKDVILTGNTVSSPTTPEALNGTRPFIGWYYEPDAQGDLYDFNTVLDLDSSHVSDGVLNLYAAYEAIYYYHLQDGTQEITGDLAEIESLSDLNSLLFENRPDAFQISLWYADDYTTEITTLENINHDIYAYSNVTDDHDTLDGLLNNLSIYTQNPFDTLLIRGAALADSSSQIALQDQIDLVTTREELTLKSYGDTAYIVAPIGSGIRHLRVVNGTTSTLTLENVQLRGHLPEGSQIWDDAVAHHFEVPLTSSPTTSPNTPVLPSDLPEGNNERVLREDEAWVLGGGLAIDGDSSLTLVGANGADFAHIAYCYQDVSGGGLRADGDTVLKGNFTIAYNYSSIEPPSSAVPNAEGGGGVYTNKSLIVEEDVAITYNKATAHGGGVFVKNGIFTFQSGAITHNQASTINGSYGGGGVFHASGTFEMHGGAIDHNRVSNGGGGVYHWQSGSILIAGGSINHNTTTSLIADGGGFCLFSNDDSLFTMTGGDVSYNYSARRGGGIHASGRQNSMNDNRYNTLITGGTITYNEAADYGGGLNTSFQDFKIQGAVDANSVYIAHNTAGTNGGGFYAQNGNAVYQRSPLIENATITDNTAGWYGGGIYTEKGVSTTVNFATIANNTAQLGGGIFRKSGALHLSATVMEHNTATNTEYHTAPGTDHDEIHYYGSGGAIYTVTDYGNLTIDGLSTFSGNTAPKLAIYASEPHVIIYDNTIDVDLGNWSTNAHIDDAKGYNNYDINYRNYTVTFDAKGKGPNPPTQYFFTDGLEKASQPQAPTLESSQWQFIQWEYEGTAFDFDTFIDQDYDLEATYTYQPRWYLQDGSDTLSGDIPENSDSDSLKALVVAKLKTEYPTVTADDWNQLQLSDDWHTSQTYDDPYDFQVDILNSDAFAYTNVADSHHTLQALLLGQNYGPDSATIQLFDTLLIRGEFQLETALTLRDEDYGVALHRFYPDGGYVVTAPAERHMWVTHVAEYSLILVDVQFKGLNPDPFMDTQIGGGLAFSGNGVTLHLVGANTADSGFTNMTNCFTNPTSLTPSRFYESSGSAIAISGNLTIEGNIKISKNRLNDPVDGQAYGTIFHSTTSTNEHATYMPYLLTMLDGEISENVITGKENGQVIGGGGIYSSGTVVMSGGIIHNNQVLNATGTGGGILMQNRNSSTPVSVTVKGNSIITNNHVGFCGGGVRARNDVTPAVAIPTITISESALISHNTSGDSGGGVGVIDRGSILVNGGVITGNIAQSLGGGIEAADSLTVVNAEITENSANTGGGGICNSSTTAQTQITNSLIRGNQAGTGGGAYFAGQAVVSNTHVEGNHAGTSGGGIRSTSTVALEASTINENTAGTSGGGLYVNQALTITDSFINDNKATTSAGGMIYGNTLTLSNTEVKRNEALTYGGGIVKNSAQATLIKANSIISENTAGTFGGGIYATNTGTLTISDSEITDNVAKNQGGGIFATNTAGLLTLNEATLLAENTAPQGGAVYAQSNLTLSEATLQANTAKEGGAIYQQAGTLSAAATITENHAKRGAGIYNNSPASHTLTAGTLSQNIAERQGGAIYQASGEVTINGTLLTFNNANQGGGVYNLASLNVSAATLTENGSTATTTAGGGIYTSDYANLMVSDCDFHDNQAMTIATVATPEQADIYADRVHSSDWTDCEHPANAQGYNNADINNDRILITYHDGSELVGEEYWTTETPYVIWRRDSTDLFCGFVGWQDGDGTDYAPLSHHLLTESLDLYAQWDCLVPDCCSDGVPGSQGSPGIPGEDAPKRITDGLSATVAEVEIITSVVPFRDVVVSSDTITLANGILTLTEPGTYVLHWWLAVQGTDAEDNVVRLQLSTDSEPVTSHVVSEQVAGVHLIEVTDVVEVTLNNVGGAIKLADLPVQGGVVVYK